MRCLLPGLGFWRGRAWRFRLGWPAPFSRRFGNFAVTNNLALAASDFTAVSTTVPADPRLPDGSGSVISGLVDRNPHTATPAPSNLFTLARDYSVQFDF